MSRNITNDTWEDCEEGKEKTKNAYYQSQCYENIPDFQGKVFCQTQMPYAVFILSAKIYRDENIKDYLV